LSGSGATTPALRFSKFGITFVERHTRKTILENCDLDVPAGGFYLLRGPSGSGKSTILRLLTGLWNAREQRPRVTGECVVLGENIELGYPGSLRNRVAAVLQDEGLLDDLSPRENVELALTAAGRSTKLAVALLSQTGLEQPPDRVAVLSGGMRKRAGVARGLAADPELFIFDEPTAGLDAKAARQLAELLLETHGQAGDRRTTIVITHDLPAFEGIVSGILEIDTDARTLHLKDPGDLAAAESSPLAPELEGADEHDPLWEASKRLVAELGSFAQTVGQSVLHLPPVFFRLAAKSTARCLVESAFFVAVGSLMLGFLATFFALRNSPVEGAFEDQIITGVGKVLVSVLAPMIVGFFFTARMAAGAAARLGTMRRTNQVAALTLMGIRPADYLLTPLIFGFCLAMPIVTFGGVVLSSLASMASAALVSDVTTVRWTEAFFAGTGLADVRFILMKTGISGYLVAVWTYHLAMGPKRSGLDVGNSVNLSIVTGMLTVLTVHGLFTLWQFA
jgi:ABC-type multidrug transport system ATPase subunit/ABC-type transporter Mla maintaining outer membrane lipid asymmetry permease subunit MlaE